MSKYDDFVSKLKKEADETNVIDLTDEIKTRYRNNKEYKKPIFKRISYKFTLSFAIIILVFSSIFIIKEAYPGKNPSTPSYFSPKTVDEAYAFELLTAANLLYSSEEIKPLSLSTNKDFNEIANRINKHYLTIQNLLSGEKINYTVAPSTKSDYTYQMMINSIFNDSFDLQYTIYYNKILIGKDDEEEIYNIDGIIIINNKEYPVIGKTEIDDDETSTMVKIIIDSDSSTYFIIEQEKEEDENEFVYRRYINNEIVKEYALSHEIEKGKVEVKIEINEKGKTEEIKAKLKNGQITLKVEFDDYKGNVQVTTKNNGINYYFVSEKTNIVINLIKNKKV